MTALIRGDEMKVEGLLQVGTVGEFVTVTTDVKTWRRPASVRTAPLFLLPFRLRNVLEEVADVISATP